MFTTRFIRRWHPIAGRQVRSRREGWHEGVKRDACRGMNSSFWRRFASRHEPPNYSPENARLERFSGRFENLVESVVVAGNGLQCEKNQR